ncbi:MAG: DJ-1/PfpI family protein [Helicobacter sp.]|nr:DJ-1/PfpI family protein [Helicobacter sp.]
MHARVLVVLGDGFEELEAISVIDVLKRVECEVILVGLKDSLEVISQGKVKLMVDKNISEIQVENLNTLDAIVFPGGWTGTQNLIASESLKHITQKMHQQNKIIAAICAAPLALCEMGILEEKNFTCYPSIELMIKEKKPNNIYHCEKNVVCDGNVLTSRGPATALEFAFALAEALVGSEKTQTIKKGMLAL